MIPNPHKQEFYSMTWSNECLELPKRTCPVCGYKNLNLSDHFESMKNDP
jgi:hypothetical protein